MTNDERDELIVEMHTDIKWVKESLTSHLKSHLTWAICIMGAVASVAGGCLVYNFTH